VGKATNREPESRRDGGASRTVKPYSCRIARQIIENKPEINLPKFADCFAEIAIMKDERQSSMTGSFHRPNSTLRAGLNAQKQPLKKTKIAQ
jgi:hypothetical protein